MEAAFSILKPYKHQVRKVPRKNQGKRERHLNLMLHLQRTLLKGYSDIKERSLLNDMEGYVTLHLEVGRPVYTPSFAFDIPRRFLTEEKVEAVKGLAVTTDQKGAVFDVPVDDFDTYLIVGCK